MLSANFRYAQSDSPELFRRLAHLSKRVDFSGGDVLFSQLDGSGIARAKERASPKWGVFIVLEGSVLLTHGNVVCEDEDEEEPAAEEGGAEGPEGGRAGVGAVALKPTPTPTPRIPEGYYSSPTARVEAKVLAVTAFDRSVLHFFCLLFISFVCSHTHTHILIGCTRG
jgi:hypothetical protein